MSHAPTSSNEGRGGKRDTREGRGERDEDADEVPGKGRLIIGDSRVVVVCRGRRIKSEAR